jgi:hypothetical protein
MEGWRGTPEVRHRDRALGGARATVTCTVVPLNDRCLAALPAGWLALTADGLIEIAEDGGTRAHGEVVLAEEAPNGWEENRRPALHTSPDGRFAAVVIDYGAVGTVVDLRTDSVVSTVDRHDYHTRTTPFPVAFTRIGDHTVVIAATEWNRLDAFDAATGGLLTARDTAEHSLDYFHGTLLASPSGRWLFDDGWVWQPTGIRTVIDAAAWLAGDLYAPEHGKTIGWYSDDWDQPAAWVDDHTIAIQRLGLDAGTMIDGVQLVDVQSGKITAMFAGPAGPMWSHGGLLYVTSPTGLEIWSPTEEARIGHLTAFHPTAPPASSPNSPTATSEHGSPPTPVSLGQGR